MPAATELQTPEALAEQKDSPAQPDPLNRRSMLKKAGMFLGAAGTLAALDTSANAASEGQGLGADEIAGLWLGIISASDGSFPPFDVFDLFGGGVYISSGQNDLSPASLSSAAWQTYKWVGPREFQAVGRFWTYDTNANPTGFGAVSPKFTVSKDGKTYHGEGPLQFFDNNGNSLGPPITIFDDGTRIA
jgi:hypothetical protein